MKLDKIINSDHYSGISVNAIILLITFFLGAGSLVPIAGMGIFVIFGSAFLMARDRRDILTGYAILAGLICIFIVVEGNKQNKIEDCEEDASYAKDYSTFEECMLRHKVQYFGSD